MNALFAPPLEDGFKLGRLWSLWDMLDLNARALIESITLMERAQGIVKAWKDHPGGYPGETPKDPVHDDVAEQSGKIIETFVEQLIILDATVTLRQTNRCLKQLRERPLKITYEDLEQFYGEIYRRLRDEIEDRSIVVIEGSVSGFYRPVHPLFGEEFDNKFRTNGLFELDEAAKCLALGRSTAGVFHLMRLMEIGIQSLCKCFGNSGPHQACGA